MKKQKKFVPVEQNWPALMGWAPISVSERHTRGYDIREMPVGWRGSTEPRYSWEVLPGFVRDRYGWCSPE